MATGGLYGNITTTVQTFFTWFIYQAVASQPSTPTGGTWNFNNNSGVPPTGWTNTPPVAPVNNVWVSIAFVSSQTPTAISWNTPGLYSTTATSANITSGTINSTPIGLITPSTGAFTTLSASGNTTIGTNTGNPIVVINGTGAGNGGGYTVFQKLGVNKGYIGMSSAINGAGSTSDDLLLLNATGTGSASVTSTGLAVTGALSTTGTNSATDQLLAGVTAGTVGFSNASAAHIYFNGSNGTPNVVQTYTAGVLRETLDANGNLGLDVTPSPWVTLNAMEFPGGGAIAGYPATSDLNISNNGYYGSGGWTYKASGTYAVKQELRGYSGAFVWSNAPQGTAGNPITFTDNMTLNPSGNLGLGVTPSAWFGVYKAMQIGSYGAAISGQTNAESLTLWNNAYPNAINTDTYTQSTYATKLRMDSGAFKFFTAPSGTAGNPITFTQAMTLDASGNLSAVGSITSGSSGSRAFISVSGGNTESFNAADTAIYVSKDTVTGRSINSAGTNNASGADYAEYEHNNGLTITKGAIVGFKSDGTLTLTYSEAIRFGIKSTNPSHVGGDTWGSEEVVGTLPTKPAEDAEQEAKDQYAIDLAGWEARLETERQKVDRIAYSGKVPVNVTGATPGDYIVAVAATDGSIAGQSIHKADMTVLTYQDAVGRVNRILPDGRCEVAVMVH